MYKLLALVLVVACSLGAQMFTETKPANVSSFVMTGTFRRAIADQDRSGVYEIYFMAPDKLKKVETAEASKGVELTLTQTLNKNDIWNDTYIKTGGVEVNVGPRRANAQPSSPNARKQMRADFARHMLAWFFLDPALYSMGFQYEKPDPASGALVLDLKGPDDFAARVFLDPKTHLPLKMSYRGRPPVIAISEADIREGTMAQETEIEVHFSDYRPENGIVLPHRIRAESGGKFLEEFEMKSCRVNPADVTASDFRRD